MTAQRLGVGVHEEAQLTAGSFADPGPRPLRADAAKNRERILLAAEEVFAAEGVAVPVDVVAERAGVGVGTLYRHFPTKEALFEAIVIARLEKLLVTAHKYANAEDPGAALFDFLREFSVQAASKRDLFGALGSAGIDIKTSCGELMDEMMTSIGCLLDRAVAAGAARPDVPCGEVVGLIVGACHSRSQVGCDDESLQRMVGVVIDGLRVASSSD